MILISIIFKDLETISEKFGETETTVTFAVTELGNRSRSILHCNVVTQWPLERPYYSH